MFEELDCVGTSTDLCSDIQLWMNVFTSVTFKFIEKTSNKVITSLTPSTHVRVERGFPHMTAGPPPFNRCHFELSENLRRSNSSILFLIPELIKESPLYLSTNKSGGLISVFHWSWSILSSTLRHFTKCLSRNIIFKKRLNIKVRQKWRSWTIIVAASWSEKVIPHSYNIFDIISECIVCSPEGFHILRKISKFVNTVILFSISRNQRKSTDLLDMVFIHLAAQTVTYHLRHFNNQFSQWITKPRSMKQRSSIAKIQQTFEKFSDSKFKLLWLKFALRNRIAGDIGTDAWLQENGGLTLNRKCCICFDTTAQENKAVVTM